MDIKSTFKIKNRLNNISELQTKQRYQVLKCNALPKQPLLIIKHNIIVIIELVGKHNSLPIKKIRIVSAILKIKLLKIYLNFSIFYSPSFAS